MAYQAKWIRGREVQGDRDCATRYVLIREIVRPFTRQLTVWDLGANLGYFGCRLADEFQAVSVMVEPRSILVDVCRENALPTTIAMSHTLSVQDLRELAACEHADLVLALNVLHHCADWRGALEAVLALGDIVVIETPGRNDTGSVFYAASQQLLDAIESLGGEVIGQTPSHVTGGVMRPIVMVRRSKPQLTAGYAYIGRVRARGAHAPRSHVIASTATEKTITYQDGESRPWIAGMNLWNWAQLSGSYPNRALVSQAVATAVKGITNHGDLRPWNCILSGDAVSIVDGGHRRSVDDAIGLRQTLEWVANPRRAYVSGAA